MPPLSPTTPSPAPRWALPPLAFAAPLALTALLALAGCGASSDSFAPSCPQLALLKDGADITRFTPRGQDVTDLVLDGRLTAVPAKCQPGRRGHVTATLNVAMRLTRGPAAVGRTEAVPYFVAVTRNGQVLDKQVYGLVATFPPNVDTITATGDDVVMDFPVTAEAPASSYRIFVSFQLTPAGLEINRRRGAR